jgi:hypothetical protein
MTSKLSTQEDLELLAQAKEIIDMVISEWTPAFLNGEYDSDEPEENALRDKAKAWLSRYEESVK